MTIRVDKRALHGHQDDEAELRVAAALKGLRTLQFDMARDLAHIEACAHFAYKGCASIVEFGVGLGLGAPETRMLVNLGKSLLAAPHLEDEVRKGEVPIENAAAIGRILGNPRLQRPGDDWVGHARQLSWRNLRRLINRRLEEQSQAKFGIVEVTLHVHEKTMESFDRARTLASRKEGKTLTEGQVFKRLVDSYLELYDPLLQKPGTRRVGATAELPDSRYVPREVQRAVRLRAGDRCEHPDCKHRIHLQFAHRRPHARGGGREANDLLLLCSYHHTLLDAGRIRLVSGPPEPIRFEVVQVEGNGKENGARGPPSAGVRSAPVGNGGADRVSEGLPRLVTSA